MRVDRINYQKTFNLGNYTSERIGLEAELEDGDDGETELKKLKKAVEDLHKATNPQLQDNSNNEDFRTWSITENGVTKVPLYQKPTPPPVIDLASERPSNTVEALIKDIDSCKDVKVLETYKLMVKKDPLLQGAYDNKLKQLS